MFFLFAASADAQVPADVDVQVKWVKTINWSRFHKDLPQSRQRTLSGKILLNANRYALTTWWKDRGFATVPTVRYLDLRGGTEHYIRPVADEAEALAISLRTGLYDAAVTGVSEKDAEGKTIQLVRSLVHTHRANQDRGWGRQWQSAAWAGHAACAGWLMWERMDDVTRRELLAMINDECEWVMNNKDLPQIKVYRNRDGKISSPGDTGSEENAWDSYILSVACAMMPEGPNHSRWMNKLIFLYLNALSFPDDLRRNEKYNGTSLKKWLVGSNFNKDGTVVNHNFIHPDYMTAAFEFNGAKLFWLAGSPIPKAFLLNADRVFRAFSELNFRVGDSIAGGKVQVPGGMIFRPGSGDIFYPLGSDWGEMRRMNFSMFNCMAALFTKDPSIRKRALEWQLLQGESVLLMQERSPDGRTYLGKEEDRYLSREEWVADKAAISYIFETLRTTGPPEFTNRTF